MDNHSPTQGTVLIIILLLITHSLSIHKQTISIYGVIVGVLSQTLMRVILFRMYHKTEIMIKSATHPVLRLPLNDITSSLGR